MHMYLLYQNSSLIRMNLNILIVKEGFSDVERLSLFIILYFTSFDIHFYIHSTPISSCVLLKVFSGFPLFLQIFNDVFIGLPSFLILSEVFKCKHTSQASIYMYIYIYCEIVAFNYRALDDILCLFP